MIEVDIRRKAFMIFMPATESGLKMEGERTLNKLLFASLENFPFHSFATAFGYGDRRLWSINYREAIGPQLFGFRSFYSIGISGKGDQPEGDRGSCQIN
jgi:hypothetical protein